MGNMPEAFLDRMRGLVSELYPACVDVYDLERERYAAQLGSDRSLGKLYGKENGGEFGAGLSDASLIADMISVISATWFVSQWLRKRGSKEPSATIEQRVLSALIEEGLPVDRAQVVARRVSEEVQTVVAGTMV